MTSYRPASAGRWRGRRVRACRCPPDRRSQVGRFASAAPCTSPDVLAGARSDVSRPCAAVARSRSALFAQCSRRCCGKVEGHRLDRLCCGSRPVRSPTRKSRCSDLRRPGGDRDPERAAVQRHQGGAGAADGHGRGPECHQRLGRPTRNRCSTRSCRVASACFPERRSPSSSPGATCWSRWPTRATRAISAEPMC